jgi:GntR family transcriptional regulator
MADDPRMYMRIYRELKDKITSGELAPNSRLNMGAIAAEYGVNRDTVRAAVLRLADEHLITRWPGIGWTVD